MVGQIETSNINPVQMFNAMSAFKSVQSPQQAAAIPEFSDGIDVNEANILKNQDLEEIKEFAKTAGEENLSEDDIKYGITYGRSVIADYIA